MLVRGQTNVRILRSYVTALDDRIFEQQQLVERLRTQVDACVNGGSVSDGTAPAKPPVVTTGGAS